MKFDEALALHLKAIDERDLDGYLETVHQDATLILPNGTLLTGKDEIAKFHREWFADQDWSMSSETVRVSETGDSAFALLAVAYNDVDPEGAPYRKTYHLTLVFARSDGRWLLVHDQNTFN
ncbi:nuclear transport factor 2 family protein [Streptosporangium longisporum]|uniref:DUF4440 domain-containing protein n=1 Tax=Streptosporangium longisporum TaxID=46187 RepID=A0ABP6KN63_9ACTN